MTYQYFTVYNSMSLHNMVILLFQFLCRAWFFFLRQIKSISVIMTWIVTVTEIGFHRTIDHPSFLNLCTAMRSVEYKTRKILNRKKRFFFQRIWKVEKVPVSIVWHYLGPMNLKKKTDQKQLFSALLLYLVFSTRVFYHTKRRSRYIYIYFARIANFTHLTDDSPRVDCVYLIPIEYRTKIMSPCDFFLFSFARVNFCYDLDCDDRVRYIESN